MADVVTTPDGVRLRVQTDGPAGAPPLLLINALGATLELWDDVVPSLIPALRVIRYDARGHGGSSVPPGEYTLEILGRDALAVLDAHGVPRANVGGISLGGFTTMWLGVNAPGRVERLLVANCAPKAGTPQRWIDRAELVRSKGMPAVAQAAMSTWFTPSFHQSHPEVVARFFRMIASCPPGGYIGCCAVLREADLRPELHRIQAPTLVCAGTRDVSMSVDEAEATVAAIRGATLRTFESAHIANVECAAEFALQARAWFTARRLLD